MWQEVALVGLGHHEQLPRGFADIGGIISSIGTNPAGGPGEQPRKGRSNSRARPRASGARPDPPYLPVASPPPAYVPARISLRRFKAVAVEPGDGATPRKAGHVRPEPEA
jgi:hypothetical protein